MDASLNEGGQRRMVLTYREAAEALGVCERVVWQLVKDGELNAARLGRSVRIPVSELERLIEDRTADAEFLGTEDA